MINKKDVKKSLVNLCVSTGQIKAEPIKDTPIYYHQRKKAAEYFGIPKEFLDRNVNSFNKLYNVIINNGRYVVIN